MLTELAIFLSCNSVAASLGGCGQPCPSQGAGSYSICQSQETVKSQPGSITGTSKPKPKRLCSYYVNGTIDVPTANVITAWIEVGSRLCIGDEVPEPVPAKPKTIVDEVSEIFTAHAIRPFAYLGSASEVEIGEPVGFWVNPGGGSHSGNLFGQQAEIRFWPRSVAWQFSDGQVGSGEAITKSFSNPQQIRAIATVTFRIDYRYPGQSWVIGAAESKLSSNQLTLSVIDPPRRTLLRD